MSSEIRASSDAAATSSSGAAGLALTLETIARSSAPHAGEMLRVALEGPDDAVRLAAARAVLKYSRRDGLTHILRLFHTFDPGLQDEVLTRVDDLVLVMRSTLATGRAQVRKNVVEIVRRAGSLKLAYLLVQALSDREREIRDAALDGMRRLTESYRRDTERAEKGEIDLDRAGLEARKFALLDPILTLLGRISPEEPDEVLTLAMGLDARTDEALFGILISRNDPRAERLHRLVWNSTSPQLVSLVWDGLRDVRVAGRMLAVIEGRRDLPFVRRMLANSRFFTDHRVREKLRELGNIGVLQTKPEEHGSRQVGSEPRPEIFANAILALRAVHLVVLSGVSAGEKSSFLEKIAKSAAPMFVTGIARSVVAAMDNKRSAEEISLALRWLEQEMGTIGGGIGAKPVGGKGGAERAKSGGKDAAERWPGGGEVVVERGKGDSGREGQAGGGGSAIEMPELELAWADPRAESLPEDAFTQFFNSFDRLDEATKMLAGRVLERLDPEHLERIERELSGVDAERRLRAVKIVAALHHEEDLRRALVALAADDDRHVRATVIKTLGILEDEDAIRTLLEAATDPDRRVVANSVEAIEDMGREELAGLVRILAVHPNNRIRANAVKALWTLGDTTESGRMLDEMLRSGDEMMRLSATWVLGEIDHPARTELLTRIAGNDPSERVRVKAMGILG